MKRKLWYLGGIVTLSLFGFTGPGKPVKPSPVDYVNPFIGASTDGGTDNMQLFPGKTYPGAATPYGLVQVCPNTIDGGDNASGYSYEHTTMEGFSFATMSGTGWFGDLGNFLVMPTTGPMKTLGGRIDHPGEGWRSKFSKNSEHASAGYYSVVLNDYNIKAEMTAAPHSGILRFTFPANEHSRIQIDLARRIGGTSVLQYVKKVDDHTIEGWMKCTPDGGGWGNGDGHANYTMYFYAKFSKPLKNFGVWSADIPDGWVRKRDEVVSDKYIEQVKNAAILKGATEKEGKHLGFYSEFATGANEQVLLKSGMSLVSMDGAKANLNAEIKDWNFDAVHQKARALWNSQLSKIAIDGGTKDEKTIFYTALYHTMLDPRSVEDVTGDYTGGDNKIHHPANFTRRSIFSGWDVFRSQMPLQTIINPTLVNDLINSLVTLGNETGRHYLERWEFLNSYSGCMLGNPALPVIADAYAKGIRGYDISKTYEYAVNSCEKFGNGERGYAPEPHSISTTLEYAYDEWCLAKLSAAVGNKVNEKKYLERSEDYKNVWDPSVGWFRPRLADGSWEAWPKEGRLKIEYGTIESNPYQQGWFVPQDVPGMVKLMGGRQKVIADLNDMFEKTPDNMVWNNYYNHSNEPVHHISFLFNRFGAPWLTQKWSRQVCARAYHNKVFGLVGNEDVGQMSAWYVLAASGFHPICPGDTRYEITSPVFSKITYKLDPRYATGKTFTVIARNNSAQNVYIQSATLNGRPYQHCYLDYKDIISGGTLQLVMGSMPNHNWGIN
jgi:predicted alpha-1,2-mannosidase